MLNFALFLLQEGPDPSQIQHNVFAMMAFLPLIILVAFLIGTTIMIVPFWFICKKAGFSPWLSFLNAVPLGNLILIYILGFAEWRVVPMQQMGWQPPQVPPQAPPPAFPPQA